MEKEVLLSVVIIAKNEERHIGRCIESVLAATDAISSYEVILVDSASEDRTVELASKYPVKIIQLRPEWVHTPAAGGHIGTMHSTGKFFFYVGGDMVVAKDWFEKSIPFLEGNQEVGGVAGIENQIQENRDGDPHFFQNVFRVMSVQQVETLGGAALYRRSALEIAGGFDPFLFSEEEADLCLRIRKLGYKLFRIPHQMVDHYSIPRYSSQELIRRAGYRYYVGAGQMLRNSIKNGTFISGCKVLRIWIYVVFALFLVAGLLSLIFSIASCNIIFLIVWCLLAALIFIAFTVKKKSVRQAIYRTIEKFPHLVGLAKGLLYKSPDREDYPTDIILIKTLGKE